VTRLVHSGTISITGYILSRTLAVTSLIVGTVTIAQPYISIQSCMSKHSLGQPLKACCSLDAVTIGEYHTDAYPFV
jgi:hypothetical protein